MVYLLYGPDTYRSRQKLRGIVAAFLAKHGGPAAGRAGLTRIDVGEQPEAVFSVGRAASLFAARELVVIERPGAASAVAREHIRHQLPAWSGDRNLTVVFWESPASGKPRSESAPLLRGKEPVLLAAIRKQATKAQEFRTLAPAQASRWLDQEAARRGLRLPAEEKRLLLATHGSDLWALSNELDKIRDGWSLGGTGREATAIWDFTDTFLRHRRRAFVPLSALLGAGFDPTYLLGALASSLRTLALVWQGLASGKLNQYAAGLHPFAVKKNLELARRLDAAMLRERFGGLVSADVELKTGRLPPPLPLIKLVLKR